MSAVLAGVAVSAAPFSAHAEAELPPKEGAPLANPQASDPAIKAMEALRLSIQRLTLDNGLRVVLNPDNTFPTVAVSMTYNVGSRNEELGQSGFAHLFEHMMFQGSRHVKKGEHFTMISSRGGSLNGTTSSDRTNYFQVLPSSELALALWLEADRLKWLDVTSENFENQRQVVQEEYRMRVANAPYRMGLIRLEELAYQGYLPYVRPTIGSMADLDAAKFDWVLAFHERYYAPNNAVLVISGSFDQDEAVALVRRYFDDAKPQRNLEKFEFPPMPEQKVERQDRVEDPNVKTPGFYYAWPVAPTHSPEHYAVELAALILADGESSRLHQDLVLNRAMARKVSAWTYDRPGQDLFALQVLLTEAADLAKVRTAVDDHIDRLKREGPSLAELERSKNRLRTHFIFGLQSNLSRATKLGEYESIWGDARILTRELEGYLRVSPDDVKRAVASMLLTPRRSVVEVVPPSKESK